MADLPFEVITDILGRLPVKPLLQFRSVAKAWRSLIDSSEFIAFHISRSSDSRSNLTLLLRHEKRLFAADPDGASAAELLHPVMCYSNDVNVLGSCNGLLCISNIVEDIVIWNPATRTHRLLPHIPWEKSQSRHLRIAIRGPRVYGFGYDSAGNDYCLVRISQFSGLDCYSYETEVKVYSLRSNKWKNLENMPYAIYHREKMGVYVSGSLHWVVTGNREPDAIQIIVAMDFVNDSYCEVPFPKEGMGKWDHLDLGVLDGRLCFVAGYDHSVFDVWVMMEYGVQESWTKLASLEERCWRIRPLTRSQFGGSKVLFQQENKKLFWYDLETRTMLKPVKLRHSPTVFDACIILNSLTPVTSRSRTSPESPADKNNQRDDFLSVGFKLVL